VEDFEQKMLYRSPGANNAGRGRTYDTAAAKSQGEVDILLKDGWFYSLPEAIEAFDLKTRPASRGAGHADDSRGALRGRAGGARGVCGASRSEAERGSLADTAKADLRLKRRRSRMRPPTSEHRRGSQGRRHRESEGGSPRGEGARAGGAARGREASS
jgi:hypothetical protein